MERVGSQGLLFQEYAAPNTRYSRQRSVHQHRDTLAIPGGYLEGVNAPRALIIDLDDTLIDSTASADRVWLNVAEAFAGRLNRSVAVIDQALLDAREWYWDCPNRHHEGRMNLDKARLDVVLRGFEAMGIKDKGLAEAFTAAYTEGRIDAIEPFPGAIEAVQQLREMGLKLALITNGQAMTQRKKVDVFELELLFDSVLIEGELGFGKPEPKVYERALRDLNAAAGETWMVGDNLEWEVGVPQSMGMSGVWVDWKKEGLPAEASIKPDLIIHSVAELPGHVEKALANQY